MNYYETKQYSDEELLVRILDKEEIKNLMARRAYYYANNERQREIDELWVTGDDLKKTASYGRNWGYYVGLDSIRNYYVVEHEKKQRAALDALGRPSEALGYGCSAFHETTTPMLYIAGDGKTARGLWYVPGQETIMKSDGTAECYWTMDNMSADFVKENGSWKLWHLVVCSDFFVEAGTDFQEGTLDPLTGPDPFRDEFGTPDIPMVVHNPRYNLSDNYPPMPLPYETYTVEGSLAPEGHPRRLDGYYKYMKKEG